MFDNVKNKQLIFVCRLIIWSDVSGRWRTHQFVFFAHVLPCLHFLLVHGMQLSKVTLTEVSDQRPFLQSHLLHTHTLHSITPTMSSSL